MIQAAELVLAAVAYVILIKIFLLEEASGFARLALKHDNFSSVVKQIDTKLP